jgi:hypothetical protein
MTPMQKARAWDRWLDCQSQQAIAAEIAVPQQTISGWITEIAKAWESGKPPGATAQEPWGHVQAVARPVPFGVRTAERYMAVAAHPLLSKATHGSSLPPSWRTLYDLSRLPEPTLRQALDRGGRAVLTKGTPELVRAVEQNRIAVSAARFPADLT